MLIRFDGMRVIVAGAARGIGRAITRAFAADGADVVACDDRAIAGGPSNRAAAATPATRTQSGRFIAGRVRRDPGFALHDVSQVTAPAYRPRLTMRRKPSSRAMPPAALRRNQRMPSVTWIGDRASRYGSVWP